MLLLPFLSLLMVYSKVTCHTSHVTTKHTLHQKDGWRTLKHPDDCGEDTLCVGGIFLISQIFSSFSTRPSYAFLTITTVIHP